MNEDLTDLSGHAAVLRRRWWIIVLAAVIGAVLGALAAPLASPTNNAATVVQVPVPLDATDGVVVGTQVEVITSDGVVEDVVADLGGEVTAGDLLDSLTVEVIPDTTTISITAAREDPDEAAQVANAFAESYLAINQENLLAQQATAIARLRSQLAAASERLVRLRQEVPFLVGSEQIETEAAISRQQQRQARLVDQLADAQDPTLAAQPAEQLQKAVAPSGGGIGDRVRTALFGLVLGLLVGLAIAYARHNADDRIRDEDALVALVGGTPILGRIPRAKKGRGGGGDLRDPSSKTAEAYRGLAVNLRLRVEHPRGTGPKGRSTTPSPPWAPV